jgi:hypothetical protein
VKKASWLKCAVTFVAIASMLLSSTGAALGQANQDGQQIALAKPQAPMENVFFNVLWGSVVGGMLRMGWSTVDDSETEEQRYTVSNLTTQFLWGATYGGLLGLGAGIYLSMQGITFDENLTKIAFFPAENPEPQRLYRTAIRPKPKKDTLHLVNFQIKF